MVHTFSTNNSTQIHTESFAAGVYLVAISKDGIQVKMDKLLIIK